MIEKNKGRFEKRELRVYDNLKGISKEWKGLNSIYQVTRIVIEKRKKRKEIAYFISSLSPTTDPRIINQGIRNHWAIENSLHYTKDVTFKEDESKIIKGNAPENLSLIRNIVLNILRKNKFKNIASALRKCSNNVPFMSKLLLE